MRTFPEGESFHQSPRGLCRVVTYATTGGFAGFVEPCKGEFAYQFRSADDHPTLCATLEADLMAVLVTHELGVEAGVVLSQSNPARGEQIVYTVQFADGTISSWAADRVVAA